MAQQHINVGTSANDGTGDTLRASQQKAESNFTELYAIAGGSGGTQDLQSVTDVGNTTTNAIYGNAEISSTNPITNKGAGITPDGLVIAKDAGIVTVIDADLLTATRAQQVPDKDGTFAMTDDVIPYVGATGNVSLGVNDFTANVISGNVLKASGGNDSPKIVNGTVVTEEVGLYSDNADQKIATWNQILDEYKYANGHLSYDGVLKYDGSEIAKKTEVNAKQDILTDANTHTFVDSLTALTTPVDADRMLIVDNSVSLAKKITWANVKSTLKTYFDTFYQTLANLSTSVSTDQASNTKYPSVKSVYDWATGLFATKSMGAYSFRVNNTNATANSTETTYKALGKQTLSATGLVFTGTTAPSGTATLTYNFAQVGNLVTVSIKMLYTVAGTAITAVSIPFPSDLPTPIQPNGFTSASEKLYIGVGQLSTSKTVISATLGSCFVRNNSANSGYDIVITGASTACITLEGTVTYLTS